MYAIIVCMKRCRLEQKIRSAAHTSFSILGLSITLILGSIIILLEIVLSTLLVFVQQRRNKGLY